MDIVCSHCKQERLKNNTDTAFVVFCRTGKSRSTFAMAVAGLILCHVRVGSFKAFEFLLNNNTLKPDLFINSENKSLQ